MRQLFWLGLLIFFTNNAWADGASFNVVGTITGTTCKVDVVSPNTVGLPVRSRLYLSSIGQKAGKTPFELSVTKCATNASLYFQSDQASISTDGRLKNTANSVGGNGAQGVELEISNVNNEFVDLSKGKGLQNIGSMVPGATADSGSYKFFVQYYASGNVTAGRVRSSLTFLLESF